MKMLAVPLLLSALLAGCVTDQAAQAPSAAPIAPGQAALTISRTNGFYASGVSADINANGVRIASLGRGETFSGGIKPGPVVLSVTSWSGPGQYVVRFNAEPGKRYAFEISPRDEQFGIAVIGGMVGVSRTPRSTARTRARSRSRRWQVRGKERSRHQVTVRVLDCT